MISTKLQKIDQKIFIHNPNNALRGICNYRQSGVDHFNIMNDIVPLDNQP